MNTTTLVRTEVPAAVPPWRTVAGVFKLRIGVLIMLTALVGMLVTPGHGPGWLRTCLLALHVLHRQLKQLVLIVHCV